MISRVLGNTRIMLTLAGVIALGGYCIGYSLRDFRWFARSGALIVSVGVTLLARTSIIRQDIIGHELQEVTGLSQLDPEHYKKLKQPIPDWVILDRRTRAAVGIWGPVVTCLGTLIWGFGDLLNKLIF